MIFITQKCVILAKKYMKEKITYKRKIREIEDTISVENEVVEGYIDVKLPKKHRFNNGGFITVFQQAMYNISKFADLTKGEYKLLLFLLGTAGIDNSIIIDLDVLTEELNEKKSNLSTYLKGLTKRNIVIRRNGYRGGFTKGLPMELSLNYDQINYDLAYNGKIKEYSKIRVKHPEIETEPLKILENKEPNLFSDFE